MTYTYLRVLDIVLILTISAGTFAQCLPSLSDANNRSGSYLCITKGKHTRSHSRQLLFPFPRSIFVLNAHSSLRIRLPT